MINCWTIYALFVTPAVLVFPTLSDKVKTFEFFIDFCFTLDIILNFFKMPAGSKDLRKVQLNYLKTLFVFDCVASLPGLITGESSSVNFTKLFRLVHWSRFF